MATLIFKDASLVIDAVDLSDHIKSININYEAEQQDDTAMGDDTKSVKGGLLNWSASVEFHQDYAAANVDATLFQLMGTTVAVVIKPTSAAVSAANPSFSGNALVASYTPVGGSVGDLMAAPIELMASKGTGSANLVRATS